MATTQTSLSASPSPAPARSPSQIMEEVSEQLTATQQEAQAILRNVLQELKEPDSDYYERYGKWVARHPKLSEFCFRCVRPNAWKFFDGGRWTLDALKLIGGDLRFEGRGIYFDGVLGLDRHTRIYVGQSLNVRYRVGQHLNFRHRRDNPSLHYHAVQQSVYNVFGILAAIPGNSMGGHALPGMDCPDLLLNLLEMWMCLLFRCLPRPSLVRWLPGNVRREGEFGALNIASPLDFGAREREWIDLSEWDDALVQEYLSGNRRRSAIAYTKARAALDSEEAVPMPDRSVSDRGSTQPSSGQHVVQITAPAVALILSAVVVGAVMLRGGAGLRRR